MTPIRVDYFWPQRYGILALLIPALLLIPSLLQYLRMASSLALGACLAAALLILAFAGRQLVLPCPVWNKRATVGVWVTVLLSVITVHLLIAGLMRPVNFGRACFSAIPLLLVLTAGYGLGFLLATTRDFDVERSANVAFGLLCVVGLLTIAGVVPIRFDAYFKPVFPYTEPSHFALVFLPFLMLGCVRRRGFARLALLLLGLGIAWMLESLTLVAGWLMISTICLPTRTLLVLLAAVVPLAAQLDLTYYIDRLNFGGEGQNLSTLVYLQGWQLLSESLQVTAGFGLGFQQLGVYGTNVASADAIYSLIGDNANLLDGGFLLAKIVSEFGVLGMLVVLLYLWHAARAVRGLRRQSLSTRAKAPAIDLARCVIVCFALELFVRGAGYFSGTMILLVAALTTLSMRTAIHPATALACARASAVRF